MTKLRFITLMLTMFTLLAVDLYAQQVPQEFNYQAIARDGSGNILADQSVDVKATICTDANCTNSVWTETHAALTTNQFGLVNIALGSVTPFALDFSSSAHYLKIEIDIEAGLVEMGTTRFLSVPYAMVAGSSVADTLWKPNGSDVYFNGGYAGIGTTTPGAGLELKSSVGYGSAIGLNNTGGGTNWRISSWTDGSLRFVQIPGATFTAMTIDNTGKVGIGTTAPDYPLHVKQTTSNRAIEIEHHSTTDNWTLGVGASTKNCKFIYNGLTKADIASADGAYLQASDRNLKKDIEPMGTILDKVVQLKPSKYHYIDGREDMPKSYGFIAQEVHSIFPEIVREIDGNQALAYADFSVMAIQAIQEQQQLIEDQKEQIENMKIQLEQFENELKTIHELLSSSGK